MPRIVHRFITMSILLIAILYWRVSKNNLIFLSHIHLLINNQQNGLMLPTKPNSPGGNLIGGRHILYNNNLQMRINT